MKGELFLLCKYELTTYQLDLLGRKQIFIWRHIPFQHIHGPFIQVNFVNFNCILKIVNIVNILIHPKLTLSPPLLFSFFSPCLYILAAYLSQVLSDRVQYNIVKEERHKEQREQKTKHHNTTQATVKPARNTFRERGSGKGRVETSILDGERFRKA